MRVAGVDDAGRGAVIGPLVIAGVLLKEQDLPRLGELGVRDSKRLSPRQRTRLADEIKKLASKYHVMKLLPAEIDKVVTTGKKLHRLNRLEAQTMAKAIAVLKPNIVFVDASDVLADRFKSHILENLSFDVQIVSEHKADEKYPVVSAASIIAKVERDRAIHELQKKHGNIGCGYPTDSKTTDFLENWIQKFGIYPDFVRKSWKTAKRMRAHAETKQAKPV